MRIWKYELQIEDIQEVAMPQFAELLSVANQQGQLCLWAMVDASRSMAIRCIEIIGTGNPVAVDMGLERKFIGTAIVGHFVWHVFERLGA